jgi:lysozyme
MDIYLIDAFGRTNVVSSFGPLGETITSENGGISFSSSTAGAHLFWIAQGGGVHNVSKAGLNFIAQHEGYSSTVYNDAGGYPTVGYGHLILPGENYNKGITKTQGLILLKNDAGIAVNNINRLVNVPLNQYQFDALTSYVFNTGSLSGSPKLLQNLNAGNFSGAASEMDIITSGGNIVNGLIIRRQDEQNLFLYGKY